MHKHCLKIMKFSELSNLDMMRIGRNSSDMGFVCTRCHKILVIPKLLIHDIVRGIDWRRSPLARRLIAEIGR